MFNDLFWLFFGFLWGDENTPPIFAAMLKFVMENLN